MEEEMKTLNQHNAERWKSHEEIRKLNEPQANGIECPICKAELWDTNPMRVLTSDPPQKEVHCLSCGHRGYRLA